jgi:hypothetical protein
VKDGDFWSQGETPIDDRTKQMIIAVERLGKFLRARKDERLGPPTEAQLREWIFDGDADDEVKEIVVRMSHDYSKEHRDGKCGSKAHS